MYDGFMRCGIDPTTITERLMRVFRLLHQLHIQILNHSTSKQIEDSLALNDYNGAEVCRLYKSKYSIADIIICLGIAQKLIDDTHKNNYDLFSYIH